MKIAHSGGVFVIAKSYDSTRLRSHIPARIVLSILVLATCLSAGCVKRTMLIRSYPEGAVVYVDQQEVGRTPIIVPFRYYGAHRILLEKDGFETVEVDERVDPPWYQIPPLDFFAENLWPYEIRDDRIVEFQLAPQEQVREIDLLERANMLRDNVHQGYVAPLIDSSTGTPTSPDSRLPQPIISGPR